MIRRLLLSLSLLALAIGVVLAAGFVGGQWRADLVGWARTDPAANTWRAVDVVSGRSGICLFWQQYDFATPGKALVYAGDEHRVWGISHETNAPLSNPFAQGRPLANGTFFNRIGFGYRLG